MSVLRPYLSIKSLAKKLTFSSDTMWVELTDGRSLGVPLIYFPKLHNATEEQLRASEQVQEAVGTVSAVAEESAAASEEVATSIQETRVSMQQVAASAQELALNADQLRSLISRFKTLEKKKSDIKIETLYFKSMENKSRPTIASKNVAKKKVTLS